MNTAQANSQQQPKKIRKPKPFTVVTQKQRDALAKINKKSIAERDEKKASAEGNAKAVEADKYPNMGLTAKEMQEWNNAEYFRKLEAGEIQEHPVPSPLAMLVIRDDNLGEPI